MKATGRDAPHAAASAPRLNLVVHGGPDAGTEIPCKRIVTLLGSRDGCKVALRHKRVSPVHVAIINDGEEIRAADLVTPAGTLLHGLKMELESLSDGDTLTFGPWEFQVRIHPAEHGGLDDAQPLGLEPTPQVVALEHILTGRILQPNRPVCIIGRRSGCDIAISDSRVSRVHAILFRYFGHPAVFDLLSKHPTLVNDAPVGFKMLKNEDLLTIGDSRFKVRIVNATVGGKPSDNGKGQKLAGLAPAPPPPSADVPAEDLIDIAQTEGSQTWRIADKIKKRVTRNG